MSNPTLKVAAIHEAGHVVVARILGVACDRVSILDTAGSYFGVSALLDPRFNWKREDGTRAAAAEKFALALLAGSEAEWMLAGKADVGSLDDVKRARACLEWAGMRHEVVASDRCEMRLRKKAADLVEHHRADVERVAGALVATRKLTGEEIDALLGMTAPHDGRDTTR